MLAGGTDGAAAGRRRLPRKRARAPHLADAAVAIAEASLAATPRRRGHAGGGAADAVHPPVRTAHRGERAATRPRRGPPSSTTARPSAARPCCASPATAALVVARTDDDGNVLDIGRRRRTVSPALARALRLRDRGCRFPGCRHAAFVDAHHIEHWAQGGATSLRNLVLVCHAHHVALHEGGFRVEHGAQRRAPLPRSRRPHDRALRRARRPSPATSWARFRSEQHRRGIRIDRRTSAAESLVHTTRLRRLRARPRVAAGPR